ncbi:hypothetical protein DYB32_004967 [Aphanomyces invadans]|uniref:E3 ubiquitin-protein ligase n=1 Tax=Aphanomyces invadans TaxID=157072 RepID=A0A3R6ZQA8_9STRA|nr:hypothetical protein DYB32_004967 [Aphanomyces invadans]
MGVALPPLTGLNDNTTSPHEAFLSLREAVRRDCHSDVALRKHITCHLVTLNDTGVHNLLQVLDCYLVDDMQMTMPEFLASRGALYGPVNRNKCEEVWNGDHIAYRCRTSDTLAFWLTFGVLLPLDCCDAVGVLYLKLLMDKSFKKAFSLRFLDAYAYYIQLYLGDTSSDSGRKHLSRHIDRLFCQLFHSSEQLRAIDAVPYRFVLGALHGLSMSSNARMTLSESLTYFCLREMANLLASAAAPTLRTNHVLIKTRVYARFCSELRCLLVHPDFAAQTIVNSWSENKNESIYQALLDILTTMQCMDTQVKQTGRHVDFESDAWQAAFVLDYEVLLVWQYLVQGLHHALETATMNKPLVLQMWLSPVADQLRRWWLAHGDCVASGLVNVQHQLDFYATRHCQLDRAVVATSMHLPLHHLFGSLLDEAHRYEPKDLLWTLVQREDRDFWFRLVVHLFQVHLFVRGIKCYEWVLNGQTMLHQVIHYHSRHWRYHGLHNDLFLLQLAAAALPPCAFTTLFLSQWLEHCTRAKDMRMTAEGLKVLLQVVLDPTKIAAVTPWDLLVPGTFEEDEDIIGRVLAQVGDLAIGSDMAETLPHMVLRGLEGGAGTGKSCTYVLKASAWALVCPLFESYSAMDVQKCDENAMLHDKTVVLQPVLQYLDAAFRSPGAVPWTAKDRQAQILAKMKAQQQAFLIKQLEDDPDNLPLFDSKADDDAAEPDDSIPTSSPDIHADGEVCALCHGPHTSTDALEYMGCLTPSNMGTLTKPPYTLVHDGMSVDEFLRFHLDATSQVTLRHLVGLVRPVAVEPADAVAIVLHRMASANSLATKAAALTAALDEILQSSFGQDVVDGCMADTPLSSTLCQLGIVMYVLNQRRQSHVRRHDSVEAWLAYVGVPAVAASIAAAPTGDALANAATVSIHESTELRVSSPLGAQRIVWRDATTFSLVALPKLYVDIYLQYCQNTVRCTKCQQVPVHPALCLLCGVLLLLGNGRCCIWGSVYLDRNGEEDAHFRRGKTLYLNQDRIAALTRLVVLHGFTENTAILNSTSRRDGARY